MKEYEASLVYNDPSSVFACKIEWSNDEQLIVYYVHSVVDVP